MATSKYKNPDKYIERLKKELEQALGCWKAVKERSGEMLSNKEKMHEIVVADLKASHEKELAKLKEKDGRVVADMRIGDGNGMLDSLSWDDGELPSYGDEILRRYKITRVVVTKPEDEDETAFVTIEAEPCNYIITTQRPKPC